MPPEGCLQQSLVVTSCEMPPWLRVLAAVLEDPGSFSSTVTPVLGVLCHLLLTCGHCTHMLMHICRQNIHMHKINKFF